MEGAEGHSIPATSRVGLIRFGMPETLGGVLPVACVLTGYFLSMNDSIPMSCAIAMTPPITPNTTVSNLDGCLPSRSPQCWPGIHGAYRRTKKGFREFRVKAGLQTSEKLVDARYRESIARSPRCELSSPPLRRPKLRVR
jgi:hypothetical protein